MSNMRQLSSGCGYFSLIRKRNRGDLIYMYKIYMHAFSMRHSVCCPPPALGLAVKLSRFTNSGVKPVSANMRSSCPVLE